MKKLMIVAVAVCMAAVSQAASIDWKISTKDKDVATLKGKTYYVFNGDLTTQLAAALGNTTDGGVAGFTDFLKTTEAIGTGAATKINASDTYTKTGAGTIGSALTYLIFNDTIAEGKTYEMGAMSTDGYIYMAAPEGQQTSPGYLTFSYTGAATGTIATQSIPEPTSGLLLVLGMAGLALRRRRA